MKNKIKGLLILISAVVISSVSAVSVSARECFDDGEIDTYFENHTLGIIGGFNGWTSDIAPMTNPDGDGIYVGVVKDVPKGDYEFKVRADEAWEDSWGEYEEEWDRTMNSWTNCSVTVEGTTDLIVMLDTNGDDEVLWPVTFFSTEEMAASRYGIIGSMTNWSKDIPMYEYADGKYIGIIKNLLSGDYDFKVRADSSWNEYYGVYEEYEDRTNNSQTNCSVTVEKDEGSADVVVFFDTTDDDDQIWPISYAVIEDGASLYECYTGKQKDYQDFGFAYTSYGENVIVTGYYGSNPEVVIPSKINGKSVTSIGDNAFNESQNLTSITIPDSVTSIGECAFRCVYLKSQSITVPDSVTSIGDYAFYGCRLKNITLGNSVTNMGDAVFADSRQLESINIPNSLTSISNGAFQRCGSLSSINIPDSITSIGGGAFAGCGALTNIDIPAGVTNIGGNVFADCTSLISINVDQNNKKYLSDNGVLFNKHKTEMIACPGNKKDKYIIPDGITDIAAYAFCGCRHITVIVIPDSVTNIGGSTFFNCSSLTSINIPLGVTSIGVGEFWGCSSLTNINIPSGVTSIGNYAFNECSSLKSINFPNSITSIGNHAFEGCNSLTSISIPSGVTNISDWTFQNCSSLASITIPESVTSIGYGAFECCSSLTSITIPESVTNMDNYIFYDCNNLTIYGKKGSYAEEYANSNSIPFVALKPFENKSEISADSIMLGKTVKVTAKADNENGNYTYAVFYKKQSEKKWTLSQDYSFNDTVKIRPSQAVKYDICVKVKDSTGTEAKKYFVLDVFKPVLTNLSEIDWLSVNLGEYAEINCSAEYGTEPYTYAVYYSAETDSEWTEIQPFSENENVRFKPEKAVHYNICVKAKDSSGKISEKYFALNVTENILSNTSELVSHKIVLGEYAQLKCSASGGTESYTYAVYYCTANAEKWKAKQTFSSNESVKFKPAEIGIYNICVKVKDSTGTISKKYFNLEVTENNLVNTSELVSANVELGENVLIKCSASGGTAPYQYAVYYSETDNDSWTTKQSFSENNAVTVSLKKVSAYNICVKVRDANNHIDKIYFTMTVTKPSLLTVNSYLASSVINKGDTAVAICSAQYGSEPYTYALYAKKTSSSSWTTVQSFNSNSMIMYKPTSTGNYDICVKVKDHSGKISKQYLELTVK